MKRLVTLMLTVVLVSMSLFAGCGSSPAANTNNAGADSSAAKKKYTIAAINWDPGDIYVNATQLGAEMEAKRIMEEEGVEIEFKIAGAWDSSKQVTALQQMMDTDIAGAIIMAWEGESMVSSIEELNKRNIPVVTHNTVVPGGKSVFVSFDNYQAGVDAANACVERLKAIRGEDWAAKGGVILELRGNLTNSADIGRHEGYHSVFDPIMEKNPNLKWETTTANFDATPARKFVDDMITRYGDQIIAVCSIDGTMGAGGAIPAFDARGMLYPVDDPKHIPIVTVDGSYLELESINRGYMDSASVQPAIGEGIMDMRLLWQMIKDGKQMDNVTESSVLYEDGEELWMPVQVVPGEKYDGPWYKLTGYSVPSDTVVSDEGNWANMMYKQENGKFPAYEGKYGNTK